MSRVDKGWRVATRLPGEGAWLVAYYPTRAAAREAARKISTNIFLRDWEVQAYNIYGSDV